MEPNAVPAVRSLLAIFVLAPAGNTRLSPALGATSAAQFLAFDQLGFGLARLGSAPAPVQVSVAGVSRSSSASRNSGKRLPRRHPEPRRGLAEKRASRRRNRV